MGRRPEERLTLDGLLEQVKHQGSTYPLGFGWTPEKTEPIGTDFVAFTHAAYRANGPVFAVIQARLAVFTEARFKFRDLRSGTVFGSPALSLLENPWPSGTTGDLLARMEQDASLAGNCYVVRSFAKGREILRRLRPDWVEVVTEGEPEDPTATVKGIIYYPGGRHMGHPGVTFLPGTFAHFAPIPDPLANWRGMSWLTPILREIDADQKMTRYKDRYLDNSATPNFAVSLKESVSADAFDRFRRAFSESTEGADNAGRTLFLGGGADITPLGADLKGLDFRSVQGAGETRIAAAANVPAIIAGFSEGLDAATYSNFGQARRKFGDSFLRPQWRNAAASLAPLISVPSGAELWYDASDVSFLQEDERDAAEISEQQARTITQYVREGFTAASAVAAVQNANLSLLEHTGLVSVQLQTPGSDPTSQGGAA